MAKYVIHKHKARTLHYDLRLERNRVLKSWAVPKEPPKTKGVKRLAIPTDDHALSYATFEGEIKEGYGKGTVKIWDRGTHKVKEWTPDKIVTTISGKKLKGDYCLIKFRDSDKPMWLFFKV